MLNHAICSCGLTQRGECPRCKTPPVHTQEEWKELLREYVEAQRREWERIEKEIPPIPEDLPVLKIKVYWEVEEGYIPSSDLRPGTDAWSSKYFCEPIPEEVVLTDRAFPGLGKVEYIKVPSPEGLERVQHLPVARFWYPKTLQWEEYAEAYARYDIAERFGLDFPPFHKWWKEKKGGG